MSTETSEPRVLEVPVKGPAGESQGELSLSTDQLDDRARYRLIKLAVVNYAANQRVGSHQTKTRSEVAGCGKKPWRQKGTGHARSGSRKSPVWRGGGTVFGPHPRDYSYRINKKQRRLALRSALYVKFDAGEVTVLDGLELDAPKTKSLMATLRALGLTGKRVLIGTAGLDRNVYLSARNLPKVEVMPVTDFHSYGVLNADVVVLTRAAFDVLASSGAGLSEPTGSPEPSEGGES